MQRTWQLLGMGAVAASASWARVYCPQTGQRKRPVCLLSLLVPVIVGPVTASVCAQGHDSTAGPKQHAPLSLSHLRTHESAFSCTHTDRHANACTRSPSKKLFRYKSGDAASPFGGPASLSPYAMSPVGGDAGIAASPMASPRRAQRKIPRAPFKASPCPPLHARLVWAGKRRGQAACVHACVCWHTICTVLLPLCVGRGTKEGLGKGEASFARVGTWHARAVWRGDPRTDPGMLCAQPGLHRCWTRPRCRTTSTSTWWTGRRKMCWPWAWGPQCSCIPPAPATCVAGMRLHRSCGSGPVGQGWLAQKHTGSGSSSSSSSRLLAGPGAA